MVHRRAPAHVVGFPEIEKLAVTSCAGANGLANVMLLGTPLEAQSSALSPLI